ncbi:MAG: hypothetical protein KJT03_08800 [Verrucomicrobiae bacterium]|nr:hypothetical protein [Verrucomicrobiae bacterium]
MTLDKPTARQYIQAFERKYHYDAGYLHEVLETSMDAFAVFRQFQDMGNYRNVLPADVYFVSKIAAAQTEDCGPCTELNMKLAREAGVPEEVLKAALKGKGLSPELEAVRQFSIAVAFNEVKPGQVAEMRDTYGREGLSELAMSIASMRVYPCMKRALGFDKACAIPAVAE